MNKDVRAPNKRLEQQLLHSPTLQPSLVGVPRAPKQLNHIPHNMQRIVMSKKIDLLIGHDYLNSFAPPNNPRLCPELVDYLSNSAWYHSELELQISCPQDEQDRLQQAIGNTFSERSEQLKGDVRAQRLGGLVLIALAIVLVLAATALGVEGTIPVGVVTVTAWMMIWRAAEIFLLDIRNSRRELRKYQRIISAPKHFV